MTLGTWRLGDHDVRRIGFGTKRLTGDRHRVVALLRRVVELGVNHIDTATFYPSESAPDQGFNGMRSLGWANARLREALAPYPDDLLIATKVGRSPTGWRGPSSCATSSSRTCATSAATTSTWCTCASTGSPRSPTTSAH